MNQSVSYKHSGTQFKKVEIYRNYAFSRLLATGMSELMALRLAKATTITSFQAGELIWAKGEASTAWCYVVNGFVGLTNNSKRDTFEPLGVFVENSWFGEQHIVSGTNLHADYVCLTESELLMIPKGHILECLAQDMRFSVYLARLMAWRVQQTSENLVLMKSKNQSTRVVMGLYSIAEMISHPFTQPAPSTSNNRVQIPLAQGLLAAFCGVSRGTFSWLVRRLSNAGLLNISYGSIEINDVTRWEQFALFHRSRNGANMDLSIDDMLSEFEKLANLNRSQMQPKDCTTPPRRESGIESKTKETAAAI